MGQPRRALIKINLADSGAVAVPIKSILTFTFQLTFSALVFISLGTQLLLLTLSSTRSRF